MVDVNVAVTLGLACERVLFGGAGMSALRWVFPLDFWAVSHETLIVQTLTCEFLRKSRAKRSFWRLDV